MFSKLSTCKLSVSSVCGAEALWFAITPFIYICFYCLCFWKHSKIFSPGPMSRSFPHMFPSSNFSFTLLPLKSLTHFYLWCSRISLYCLWISNSPAPFTGKTVLFTIVCSWHLSQRSVGRRLVVCCLSVPAPRCFNSFVVSFGIR